MTPERYTQPLAVLTTRSWHTTSIGDMVRACCISRAFSISACSTLLNTDVE